MFSSILHTSVSVFVSVSTFPYMYYSSSMYFIPCKHTPHRMHASFTSLFNHIFLLALSFCHFHSHHLLSGLFSSVFAPVTFSRFPLPSFTPLLPLLSSDTILITYSSSMKHGAFYVSKEYHVISEQS